MTLLIIVLLFVLIWGSVGEPGEKITELIKSVGTTATIVVVGIAIVVSAAIVYISVGLLPMNGYELGREQVKFVIRSGVPKEEIVFKNKFRDVYISLPSLKSVESITYYMNEDMARKKLRDWVERDLTEEQLENVYYWANEAVKGQKEEVSKSKRVENLENIFGEE